MLRLHSRDEASSEPILPSERANSNSNLLPGVPTQLSKEKVIARRGSFLARGSQALTKLAPKIKATAGADLEGSSSTKASAGSSGRNFVFAALDKEEVVANKLKDKAKEGIPAVTTVKRSSSSGPSPTAVKRIRMARNFDNLDDNSKDGSIFKYL